MNTFKVDIVVTGLAGSGKSRIAQLIANTLREHKVRVLVNHEDGETEDIYSDGLANSVKNIAKHSVVTISEQSKIPRRRS
jgi:adenylylsulfate kinase-like enzyme